VFGRLDDIRIKRGTIRKHGGRLIDDQINISDSSDPHGPPAVEHPMGLPSLYLFEITLKILKVGIYSNRPG
jgi:hypothetical protein